MDFKHFEIRLVKNRAVLELLQQLMSYNLIYRL